MIIDFNIIDMPFKVENIQINDLGIFITTTLPDMIIAHKYLNENSRFSWFVDIDHEQKQATLFTYADTKDGEIWL
jgi:hypothetical protein